MLNKPSPALFLDRDGVVNTDLGYVYKKQDFEFMPGIFELCKLAISAGMKIVIITNQSGIGRGYFTELQFSDLMAWVLEEFKRQGIIIEGVLHASENPDNQPTSETSSRRKPNSVMFLEASRKFSIDLGSSIMVGDRESDMVAAAKAGVSGRLLLGDAHEGSAGTAAVSNLKEATVILRSFIFNVIDKSLIVT